MHFPVRERLHNKHCKFTHDLRFIPTVGQYDSKEEKSGTFLDRISVHFGVPKCIEIRSKKSPGFFPYGIILTHCGYKSDLREFVVPPLAVSPDNMTQSLPSRQALATSLLSALVARGLLTILSSI